ncbi:hypothetical protein COY52_00945 [Candidatus Desantisbacteria bacterium CG_4_10_14_0_8_um_filter_48_22]|uniref:HAMP domain-containing protein n=1 Tax=Candidatus Desantisbacteria bacterium CG_4_10_14_0_8_um_filter_48_22 TaxID=1974543 RepID=A0A2M7SF80_9BACT|nr:MAG: hypothetical protein AUJ67_03335 [Candidatus Desantisbacteria bacterium CG1_02_49_89]PIV56700.1 MAG: hypothetical protein COS16_03160 [Candidatus Desantisbacteria bacterium CG02_land_8_20_14_3_00_49_13]PIZ18158.1 MAG: hypothetical protein COY52_00945 [Candidatus Desantisbacteria bacterium CG_4_10_14_0_8_um_filter_48_22]PJB27629.1 MAG: hypothetical protein CO111_04315 [Candidatus Desantisbacteria bacterium CG_4_9_14_3_um_filter_50_7]
MKQLFKRRQYIVKKGFQFRYTIFILFWILLTILLVYTTVDALLPPLLAKLNIPERNIGFVLQAFQFSISWKLIILIVLAVLASILISHKIAGPLYRIERNLKEAVGSGDLTHVIILRKGDELEDLVRSINQMICGLKEIVKEDRELAKEITLIAGELEADIKRKEISLENAVDIEKKLGMVKEKLQVLTARYKIEKPA